MVDRAVVIAALRSAGCVFAENEADLILASARTGLERHDMVRRRRAGEPLEHILGWAEFCGRRIAVTPGVFVPRRRTECVVREAIRLVKPGQVVVDLGCGSGAIGAAIAAAVGPIGLYAVDIEPASVACARANLESVGAYVLEGDLFGPLPAELERRVDVLVANVPYVPTDELPTLPPEARLHEPRIALDGGDDGLDVVRRVISDARAWLAPGGHILAEAGLNQIPAVQRAYGRHGLDARVVRCDDIGGVVVAGSAKSLPDKGDGRRRRS